MSITGAVDKITEVVNQELKGLSIAEALDVVAEAQSFLEGVEMGLLDDAAREGIVEGDDDDDS